MSVEMKRELSFIMNMVGTVLSGALLALFTYFYSTIMQTQSDVAKIETSVATLNTTVTSYIKYNDANVQRLESKQDKFDTIQRSRTSTFDRATKLLERHYDQNN